MEKNCYNCKHFESDEFELGDELELVYICHEYTEASELIQFPYEEDMDCFKE